MLQTRSNVFLVAQVNTSAGGSAVVITNSSNIFITNTSLTVVVQNSAGWVVNASSTILNSAGWVVSASSTILNSAGWIVSVANTGGVVALSNSAGWAVYALDSAAIGAVVTPVASTIGTVVLAASQPKRVALSIYNASIYPLYMKMGSGAKSTDFTLMMVASGYYEMARPIYSGQLTGVWGTADGSAYITETT